MPLYEYQCTACGHRFEAIRKFSDAPLTECPKCAGVLEKLVSSPAFQFKGSGWYATDYAKKSETKTESKADTKTDTKTETKSDSGAAESKPTESTTAKPSTSGTS